MTYSVVFRSNTEKSEQYIQVMKGEDPISKALQFAAEMSKADGQEWLVSRCDSV